MCVYIHINTYMDTWYLNWCSAPLADCNGLVSTVPPKGISWWRHIVLSLDETWCCCETLIHRPTWSSGIDHGHYQPWTLPVLENDAHWAFPRGMVALIKNEECNVARIQPRGLQGLSLLYRCQRWAIESLKQMGMTQDLLFKQPKSYRISMLEKWTYFMVFIPVRVLCWFKDMVWTWLEKVLAVFIALA